MLSRDSQPYGLIAIHPRPIEVGVFLPGEDKAIVKGCSDFTEMFWAAHIAMRMDLFTAMKANIQRKAASVQNTAAFFIKTVPSACVVL